MDEALPFLLAVVLLGGIAGGTVLFVWLLHLANRVRDLESRMKAGDEGAARAPRAAVPSAPGPVHAPPPPLQADTAEVVPVAAVIPAKVATPAPTAAPPVAEEPAAPAPVRRPPPPAETRTGGAGALESFLGGRVLLVIGVVAVLFGLGFFLKLAIERGLVPPGARLLVGTAAGIAALVAGDRIRARGFNVFGQALMGGGLGALYLCDAFASVRYGFYERPVAFALAAVVALLGVALAVRRDAPFLAWLGFLGAFLAPAILGRNEDALEGLTLWLVAADLGVAAVLAFRAWPGLDVLAGVATAVYFQAWLFRWFSAARLDAAAACLAAVAAVLLALALAPPIRARRRLAASYVTLFLAVAYPLGVGADLFVPEHRTAFGLAVLAGAAALAAAAEAARRRIEGPDAEAVRAFAFAAVLAAVPILLEGDGVAPAWSAVGAAAILAAAATRKPWLACGGFAAIVLAALRALSRFPLHEGPDFTPFASGPFLSAASPCVALCVGGLVVRRAWEHPTALADLLLAAATTSFAALAAYETWLAVAPPGTPWRASGDALAAATAAVAGFGVAVAAVVRGKERAGGLPAWGPFAVALVLAAVGLAFPRESGHPFAVNALFGAGVLLVVALFAAAAMRVRPAAAGWFAGIGLLFALLTAEWLLWGAHGRPEEPRRETRFAAHVGLSATWALFAAALVAAGFLRRLAPWRWAGIAVFLLTVAKVFLHDLADLDTAYRVGSFLALGALLVGASWLYQRVRRNEAPPGGPDLTPGGGGARPPD